MSKWYGYEIAYALKFHIVANGAHNSFKRDENFKTLPFPPKLLD